MAFAVLPLTRKGFAALFVTSANAAVSGFARDLSVPAPDNIGVGYVKAPNPVIGGFGGVEQTSRDEVTHGKASADSEAQAHANIGDLGVFLGGGGAADADNGVEKKATSGGFAIASWTDRATVKTRTPRPSNGLTVNFFLFLKGSLLAGQDGTSGASIRLLLRDLNAQATLPGSPYADRGNWGSAQHFPGGGPLIFPIPTKIPLRRSVTASQPFTLGYEMKLEGSAEANFISNISAGSGEASFFGDVSGSLHWGGIESVTDDNGNPVDDWTIESDSGFDYSKPFGVPEPSSIALAAIALGVIQVRLRRRVDR
jgi:hypothetical protein